MPTALTRKPFGAYTLVEIGDGDNSVSFVAERSAYIHQIRLGGRDLLWNYPDGEALTGNSGHRNLALIPFPNRLLEGEYAWRGNDYKFEVNKPDTRSALHGFGPHASFALQRLDLSEEVATAQLAYLHTPNEHPESYPFLVEFVVEVSVNVIQQRASWQLAATNLGSAPAPVGLGWHPYYLMPGGPEAWRLQMPPNEQVVLEKAIPTGARAPGISPKQPSPINTAWDDCFELTSDSDKTVKLLGPDYSLSLRKTGETHYTQLYVPPKGEAVAVEPMSCGVNAFQVAKDEVSLAPGATVATGMVHQLLTV